MERVYLNISNMKAKVIIENGITELVLIAENDFETDIIEKFDNSKSELSASSLVKKQYGNIQSASISVKLVDKSNEQRT